MDSKADIRTLLAALAVAVAAPAAAQYYPPPPPPPPPPRYAPQYAPRYETPRNNVVRLSGGLAFANDGYYCGYYGYYGYGYACGDSYGVVWPDVNAEVDLGLSPLVGLSVGANVMWGPNNGVTDTVWEPHLDLLLRSSPWADVRGRFRVGFGFYAASASARSLSNTTSTGGALRLGAGVSFLNRELVGIGLDGIFEAGSIDGYYVSTFQLLIGPELHF